ncbi:hypothetical protein LB521_27910 [Mesorhizobium sp. BR-1-1-8]|nr:MULTISPECIES: hypothetical protein [unclassified Mesorhizobium]MBZ9973480.1 hypothetical protein [Mesorhizobium sp. BR1-1-12]MBZ9984964.1 hypothetical protein [Mesorhizobium sp. BR-1-1-8]
MTTAATQLEIAAQWLKEAAILLAANKDAAQFSRVAEDCLRVAERENAK